jgi:methylated-DNA-[protein]-cysteine S-methyltransferase
LISECLYLPDLLGGVTLEASARGLRAIRFGAVPAAVHAPGGAVCAAERQLREFLAGERFSFDLPLDPVGTAFQLEVWKALTGIPYGATASYRDIAVAVNRPKGFQAIGQANTRNPIPVIVPCHRVINADGSMGGYGGGSDRKRQLLELEKRHAQRFRETAA